MRHLFDPVSWNERPAMRTLVLAWAVAASQTPVAAWAWMSCFALGLAASRWPTHRRGDMDNTPLPSALHELSPGAPMRPEAVRPQMPPRQPRTPLKADDTPSLALSTPDALREHGEQWAAGWRAQDLSVCVLQVSLQGLDIITERYGADAGRQVGTQILKRLRQLARGEDRLVQLAGDRFTLLVGCPPDDAAALARQLASRLVHELQRPAAYRTLSNLQIGCSVGSAVWHAGDGTLEQALAHADTALALARQGGRGQARQYAPLPLQVHAPMGLAQPA